MSKLLLKDMLKYLPTKIAAGIVGFFSIPVFTRLFLPSDYGNYSLVIATVGILVTLFGWLPMSIIRFYPAYERDKKLESFYGNVINLSFISISAIVLVFLVLLLFAKSLLTSKLYSLMYAGIVVFIVTCLFEVFQDFLRSKRQIGWYSGFAVWKSIGSFGFSLLWIFLLKGGVGGILWGLILCVVIILPFQWKQVVRDAPALHFKMDSFLSREMTKYSFPLVVGNLAAWILSLSDRYILGIFRGVREVGIYSASYYIADHSMMLIVSLFMLASTPILIHIWEKKGEKKSKEFLNKLTRYYLMISVPVAVGSSVLRKPIMKLLTGQQYYEGYTVLPFVVLGVLFLGLQKRFNDGLLLYKKTNFIAVAITLSGLLNLILNFLFIPMYGYLAAAITTLISYVFLLLLMIMFSRRFFVWKFPFRSLIKVTYASAIMGIVVYFVGNRLTSLTLINLIFSVFLGGLVYFTLLFFFREFQQKEKEAMREVLKRICRVD